MASCMAPRCNEDTLPATKLPLAARQIGQLTCCLGKGIHLQMGWQSCAASEISQQSVIDKLSSAVLPETNDKTCEQLIEKLNYPRIRDPSLFVQKGLYHLADTTGCTQ